MRIMIATHRPHLGNDVEAQLTRFGFNAQQISGRGARSCSQVWNECIAACPDEHVLICNEKARPTVANITKTVELLEEGYALVGLYRFGFFGVQKDVIRIIGGFDERYVGGWHEDNDMILRLAEANMAYYETEEVPYIQMPSAWSHEGASAHWQKKWKKEGYGYSRVLQEVSLPYDFGEITHKANILPWSCSILMKKSGGSLGL